MRAVSLYIPIRQKPAALRAVKLLNGFFAYKPVSVQFGKNTLGYFGMHGRGCAAKFIKRNIKPAVNIRVDRVVTVTQFSRAYAFLGGFVFRGGSVFIRTAYIESFNSPQPAKAGKRVGGKDLDKIAQMGNVVNIRQC
jgi:hypothetical protein